MNDTNKQSDESHLELGHSILDDIDDEEPSVTDREPAERKRPSRTKKKKKRLQRHKPADPPVDEDLPAVMDGGDHAEDLHDEGPEDGAYAAGGGHSFKRVLIVIGSILVLLAVLVAAWNFYYDKMLEPVSDSQDSIVVEIPEGSTIKDVAGILYDKGLIRSAMIFESYAGRHSRGTKQIQAANYAFTPSLSSVEIFNRLLEGDAYSGAVPITIPEGKNIKEIADILEKNHICSASDFIAETNNLSKYKEKYPILSSIPEDKTGRVPLEGYLYPDTYQFVSGMNVESVVSAMLGRFQDKFDANMQAKATSMGKSVDDIVTMASIVELETKLDEDKANVASVFYNRIAAGMPLQSDITVDYARGTKTAVLSTEDTKIDSPYNTYIHTGLPVGPICSPGLPSLNAALNPATTNYYYFVADMSTGKIYFNETLEGHNADVEKYMGTSN